VTVFAALLRGVNVGGRNTVAMGALKQLCASLGLAQATTVLQSGNVVFRAAGAYPRPIERKIRDALLRELHVECEVQIRTASELRKIIEANPLAGPARKDPSHLVVVFLSGAPEKEAAGALVREYSGPEEIRFADRELYIHYGEGIGRSKLTASVLERHLGVSCTARNWNTVGKLLEVAEGLG
jgi:uncharacterized protein (DUF1697 family)